MMDSKKVAAGLVLLVLMLGVGVYFMSRPSTKEPIQIAKGESLNAHMPFKEAIEIARKNPDLVKLTVGTGRSAQQIPPDAALALEPYLDRVKVTAHVFEGDVVDRNTGKVYPSPLRYQTPKPSRERVAHQRPLRKYDRQAAHRM